MVDIQSIKQLVAKEIALAVTNMEHIRPTFNDEHAQRSGSTSLCTLRVLLVELKVELEEGLVHEYLDHFGQIPGLVQQLRPTPDLLHNVVLHVLLALFPTMPVKHGKETDQFPFTATHIFLYHQPIFHSLPEPYVLDLAGVISGHFKRQVADLDLAV